MGNILGIKVRTTAELVWELHWRLHYAVEGGNQDRTKKLIADGASADAKDEYGNTPLHIAVRKGNVEMVQLLVAEGADMDALDWILWRTPLERACYKGDHAVVEALLVAGADASRRSHSPSGRSHSPTALDMAVMEGHTLVLAVLIRHGVDLNVKGFLGTTALHDAARMNKADVIGILVAGGADTEIGGKEKSSYGTALHCASSALCREAAVALLKHGADINARDMTGDTPLHKAARQAGRRGAVEMVDLLLSRGADEMATTCVGLKTPADEAGTSCSDIEEVGGVERVRRLLANVPVAREAWRRRGLLVASRARPQMVLLSTSTQSPGEWMELMDRVLGLAEEGVFRTIVGYL